MSAPGIQLSSQPQLSFFQPTVRQYLQSVEQAVISNNLQAAQQALGSLQKALQSSSGLGGHSTKQLSEKVGAALQAVGSALKSGDPEQATEALGELRQTLASPVEGQSHSSPVVTEPAEAQEPTSGSESEPATPGANPPLNITV